MTILVTGATGFIGNNLCKYLKNKNHKIIGVARTFKNNHCDKLLLCDFLTNSLQQSDLLNVDTIYHLAGIAHDTAVKKKYMRVNVNATIALFKLAAKMNVKKFIFVSSVRATHKRSKCLDENHDVASIDNYGYSKYLAEKQLLELAKKTNIHLVIIRPALVYGSKNKANLGKLIKLGGCKFPLPIIYNRISMVGVEDLCQALYLVANSPLANKETFIVTDKIVYSVTEIYHAILISLNKTIPFAMPLFLLKQMALIGDIIKFFIPKFILTTKVLNKLTDSSEYSSNKISKILGWQPQSNFYSIIKEQLTE